MSRVKRPRRSLRVEAERLDKRAQLEIARLMVAAREAGDKAEHDRHRTRLLYASIPWLIRLAADWSSDPHDVDDLVGAGVHGLIEGLDRFDPEMGHAVGTYVRWWMRKGMLEYWREQRGQIRVSRHARDLKSKVDRGLLDREGLATGERVQVDRADQAIRLSRQPDDSDSGPLTGLLGREPDPSEPLQAEEDRAVALAMVHRIPSPKTRRTVIRHYGLDGGPAETFEAIASDEGITKQAAQQRTASGLAWVREQLNRL